MVSFNTNNNSYTDKLKRSIENLLDREVSSLQAFEQEYKISSHPLKRTFIAIGKLNKIHKGKIAVIEISQEANLSEQDVKFILQEFIDQRLIEGYLAENNGIEELILKQDSYFCQLDQTEHDVFELRMQCNQCLRFICLDCYHKSNTETCPFCKGKLTPVPRIFKKQDVQLTTLKPGKVQFSLSEYYKIQKNKIAKRGIKSASSSIIEDLKTFRKNWDGKWSLSSLKERGKTYLEYRKVEQKISKNEKRIIDIISTVYQIEKTNEIPIARIARLARLDIELTHEIVSRLIARQSINGFIETSKTYDTIEDDVLILGSDTFFCEIHDESHTDPIDVTKPHYQCSNCFRSVCASCFDEMKSQGMYDCLFCGSKLIHFTG
ncbi:MAG: hypothetical protein ACTSW1_10635 [Candidatus Hodarchaeales archaeon]